MTDLTMEQKTAYLAAFIDGEGWVVFRYHRSLKTNPINKVRASRQVGFTNTDEALFNFVVSIASDLGFRFSVSRRTWSNPKHSPKFTATLVGGADAFQKFFDIVPLRHGGKVHRLSLILASYRRNADGSVAKGIAVCEPGVKAEMLARARDARRNIRLVKSA